MSNSYCGPTVGDVSFTQEFPMNVQPGFVQTPSGYVDVDPTPRITRTPVRTGGAQFPDVVSVAGAIKFLTFV